MQRTPGVPMICTMQPRRSVIGLRRSVRGRTPPADAARARHPDAGGPGMRRRLRATGLGLALAGAVGLTACGAGSGSHVVRTGSNGAAPTTTFPSGTGGSPTTTSSALAPGSGSGQASSLQDAETALSELQSELGSLGTVVDQTTSDLSNPQGDS